MLKVIHSQLPNPGRGALIELGNPLMSLLVLPYLGASAARIQLTQPVPVAPAAGNPASTPNHPKGLPVRMTHRTMSVLAAIAAQPG